MQKIKVTLKRSLIGSRKQFRDTAATLKLNKIGSSAVFEKNDSIMGKVRQISHLIEVKEL